MRTRTFIQAIALSMIVAVAWGVPAGSASRISAQTASLVLVMAANSPVTQVSRASLRRMYQSNAVDTGAGGRFVPLNQPPNSALRVQFDRNVLSMGPDEVSQFWVDQRIRGFGEAPRSVPSPELAVRLVTRLANSIAYVPRSAVNDTVKVISTDGRL